MKKLAFVAQNTSRYNKPISATVVAVVADVTYPLFRPKEQNYIVMIKVIDESLNSQKMFGVMSKNCCVYLISKNKKDISFIHGVGDIVLLDRFSFSLWNDIKLQTKYHGTTEGLYLVSSSPQHQQEIVIKHCLSMNEDIMSNSPEIAERVRELQIWREQMRDYNILKLGVRVLNTHCVMVEPFNMVLKVVQVEDPVDKQLSSSFRKLKKEIGDSANYFIRLTDANGNDFQIHFCYGDFKPGQHVLVRGIQSIAHSRQIVLSQPGNILKVMYPIQPSMMNYMAIYRDSQKLSSEVRDSELTLIHCQNMETTYLSDLVQLQDKYDHTMRKEEVMIKDAYMVSAIAVKYEGSLSLYQRDFQILLHDAFFEELSSEQKKQYKEFDRISYVYEGQLGLIDRSNEAKGNPFSAHLFTCDAPGNFMTAEDFEIAEKAIGTLMQTEKKVELQNKIKEKLNKLTRESDFQCPVVLVLEPIRSERLLFRVVYTKFL